MVPRGPFAWTNPYPYPLALTKQHVDASSQHRGHISGGISLAAAEAAAHEPVPSPPPRSTLSSRTSGADCTAQRICSPVAPRFSLRGSQGAQPPQQQRHTQTGTQSGAALGVERVIITREQSLVCSMGF